LANTGAFMEKKFVGRKITFSDEIVGMGPSTPPRGQFMKPAHRFARSTVVSFGVNGETGQKRSDPHHWAKNKQTIRNGRDEWTTMTPVGTRRE